MEPALRDSHSESPSKDDTVSHCPISIAREILLDLPQMRKPRGPDIQ